MHTLDDAGAFEFVDNDFFFLAAFAFEYEFSCAFFFVTDFHAFVNVAICVTSDRDRLLPALHCRLDRRDRDGRTEYRTVEHRTDGSVGALPHFVEFVFVHTLVVRRDGSALYSYAVLLRCFSRIESYLVARFIAVRQT